ncbi:TenA family protein [Granulicoccus phenolivorans]|uniref:TenA family protein n=1 Tax=Granulicoccus phenolivorans TaxID=266854 RepID=UPI00040E4B18|nr:TenA family protein [Granulicoccus phenolivorans]
MRFTDELWADTATIRTAIDELPFLRRLADGTLHRDIFRHYLGQDWLYLRDYATALAQLAVQAPDGSATSFFALAAHGANEEAERLHATHVADPDRVVKSPVCQAYTDFLLATGLRAGYAVQAAAVLPCFWIYTDVGQRLWEQAGQHPDHPYADWLAAYGDPVFAEQTDRARALVDQAAAAATPTIREQMRAAHRTASRYEWMFWDAPMRQENWPV